MLANARERLNNLLPLRREEIILDEPDPGEVRDRYERLLARTKPAAGKRGHRRRKFS